MEMEEERARGRLAGVLFGDCRDQEGLQSFIPCYLGASLLLSM